MFPANICFTLFPNFLFPKVVGLESPKYGGCHCYKNTPDIFVGPLGTTHMCVVYTLQCTGGSSGVLQDKVVHRGAIINSTV